LVAKQLERWTDKTLQRLEFKRIVADGGFAEAVNRGGWIRSTPSAGWCSG
jgi:hypothetical protein